VSRNLLNRRTVLNALLGTAVAGGGAALMGPLEMVLVEGGDLPHTDRMPALFVGHGTPMNLVWSNEYTQGWRDIGERMPRPAAILSISAHWLTEGGSLVTASQAPAMNYDIGFGRDQRLYDYRYTAPGSPVLAREVAGTLQESIPVHPDSEWGFDHGTWVVLKHMFPKADIPVLQLSIDYSRPPSFHYELGQKLQALRSKGVLILGSGNLVHNLRMRTSADSRPHPWAIEFDERVTDGVMRGDHAPAVGFLNMGSVASMAHPTYDHFLPLLYCLGAHVKDAPVRSFCDGFQEPSISMRSFYLA
jgi:4,5-DOPA dioxygenase extradiol